MIKLQADRKTDRMIAGRLGYATRNVQPHDPKNPKWEMISNADLMADQWIPVPHYTTDLNAALSLYSNESLAQSERWRSKLKLNFRLTYYHVHDKWECQIDDPLRYVYKRAKTPALAICQAWWDWRDQYESGEYDNTRRDELIQEDQKLRDEKG